MPYAKIQQLGILFNNLPLDLKKEIGVIPRNRLFTEAASAESCGSPVMTGALVFLCLYPPWIVPRPLQPPLTHQLLLRPLLPLLIRRPPVN